MRMRKNTGATLVEFLIYLAIVSVVLVVAGAIMYNIFFGKAKFTVIEEVSQNNRFVMESIMDSVRAAESISSPTPGNASSTLVLVTNATTTNPTTFKLIAGGVEVQEGTSTPIALTTSEVIVNTLEFRNVSRPLTPGTVRIHIATDSLNPADLQQYEFSQAVRGTVNIYKNDLP